MKNKLFIKIKNVNLLDLTRFLINNNIYYENLKEKEDNIFLEIKYNDYIKLKGKYKKRIKIIKTYGIFGVKEFLKKEYLFILSLIFSIILIYILSNTIFFIEIVTTNEKIKKIIEEELKEFGIEKYHLVKSYEEIDKIKEKILQNNKKTLEWIEITKTGTKYTVNITERIIKEEKEIIPKRDIVSLKDALILKIVNRNGLPIKNVNDYVRKGETIVSGNIYRGETLVSIVSADADIYGEVWYSVSVTVPFEYIEYILKKELNHYYLKFPWFNMSLIGHYETNKEIHNEKILIDKPYLLFKLIKEEKKIYEYKKVKVNEKEALNEGIKRAEESIKRKLDDNEYIIDKKVLKNTSFSSKILVEVFFRVYENITDYVIIENALES